MLMVITGLVPVIPIPWHGGASLTEMAGTSPATTSWMGLDLSFSTDGET